MSDEPGHETSPGGGWSSSSGINHWNKRWIVKMREQYPDSITSALTWSARRWGHIDSLAGLSTYSSSNSIFYLTRHSGNHLQCNDPNLLSLPFPVATAVVRWIAVVVQRILVGTRCSSSADGSPSVCLGRSAPSERICTHFEIDSECRTNRE